MAGKEKLTDPAVKQAKSKEKPYKLGDGGGLYLEVMPTGAKYWRFKYRYEGKENRLALGVYPDTTLKLARAKTANARTQLAEGIDPSAQKKLEKLSSARAARNTFEAVAAEWFEKKMTHKSDSHRTRTLALLKNNLYPWLGDRPVSSITRSELLEVLRKTESRGVIETARRTLQAAGQVFRYAMALELIAADPSSNLYEAMAAKPKTRHFSTITDSAELGNLLLAMDGYTGSPAVKAALLLSPLLFQRPGEIRQMLWVDIDFEKAEWRYLVTKTDTPHIVPLSRQSLEILRWLQPITGRGRYVFPSARGGSRPLSENGVRTALRTLGYTNEQQTPHGFRATARTLLDEVLGYRVDWIERQLAHEVRDTNGTAYNRTAHLESRREMMQAWADYLDRLKSLSGAEQNHEQK